MQKRSIYQRLCYFITGMSALLWFLIRVIPKPSRATYPCMRAAAPIASSFVMYLIGLTSCAAVLRKSTARFRQARYGMASSFLLVGLLAGFLTITIADRPAPAYSSYVSVAQAANEPMGVAKGIFPGRVVWIHDPDATDENCTNSYGDGWFLSSNNDQQVIDQMVSTAIQRLTNVSTDAAAWGALFQYYNQNHGKGSIGYAAGEKILIKTNATSSWTGNFNPTNLSVVQNSYYGVSETSPHVVLAVLRQLVNVVGVSQTDIFVGDPMKHIYKHCYDLWHAEFPNVNYLDHDYGAEKGRVKVVAGTTPRIFYSDRGSVLRTGSWSNAADGEPVTEDCLYTVFEDVEYMINIPALKAHARAGISLFAKNHFGSHCRADAKQLHMGLVNPDEVNAGNTRFGMGLYRVQVDLMGHEILGGKNLFYLLDGLWAGSEAVDPPTKWSIAPFNSDWTSSIFASQDPVAIESVAFDFLKAEYITGNPFGSYPQMDGVDDYLHQAADVANWPAGISYDPENDGSILTSLGVHEHWNNAIDRQYSRNLGTGAGIELITGEDPIGVELLSFTGHECEAGICLQWQTRGEVDCAGYNIHRSHAAGPYERRNAALLEAENHAMASYQFTDVLDQAGLYFYRLETIALDGKSEFSAPISVQSYLSVARSSSAPCDFDLAPNYPNPFNAGTRIDYQMPRAAQVDIAVYDLKGGRIRQLVRGERSAGQHSVAWDTRDDFGMQVGSGVYLLRMAAEDYVESCRLTLVK
ncbi:DUF362 domain-containing protein [candidate division KSB1 bacterium]|nr:DUF362 domain-containing protein [candidate division KSB1 bacterium]RQW06049.1 MAG: DUF362 domain-containing protein [candidate division KSB1 bacterium]